MNVTVSPYFPPEREGHGLQAFLGSDKWLNFPRELHGPTFRFQDTGSRISKQ